RSGGRVEAQDVALSYQAAPADPYRARVPFEVRLRTPSGIDDAKPEGNGAPADGLADAARPKEPQGAAAQLDAEQQLGVPATPCVPAHQVERFDEAASAREDQGPRQ